MDWIDVMNLCQMIGFHSVWKNCRRTNASKSLKEKQKDAYDLLWELKVLSTHRVERRWHRSWPLDPPRCWLLPPRCSGSLGPDWESARIRPNPQLYGWYGTCSHSPSTKSAITKTQRKCRLRHCSQGLLTTFSLLAATHLCHYNWLMLLLQHVDALWVLCYISEVGKHLTSWHYVLQAVFNIGSVLAKVAITRLSVALSQWKTNGDQ